MLCSNVYSDADAINHVVYSDVDASSRVVYSDVNTTRYVWYSDVNRVVNAMRPVGYIYRRRQFVTSCCARIAMPDSLLFVGFYLLRPRSTCSFL